MRLFYEDAPPADPPANPPANPAAAGNPPANPPADPPAAPPTDFFSGLPEEMRSEPSLLKFKGSENPAHEIAKAYLNASKMIGKPTESLIELPTERNLETLAPVFRKLGAPEDGKGYQLKPVDGANEYLGPQQPLSVALTNVAAKAGLLPEQTQMVYSGMVATLQDAFKVQEEQAAADAEANETKVKEMWGTAFDQNKARMNHVAETLGIAEVLNEAGLGMHPKIADALIKIEGFMQEKPLNPVPGMPHQHAGLLAPDDARARAKALQADALNETNHMRRRELNQEAQRYWAMANGQTQQS